MLTLCVDWRNTPDLSHKPDLWSLGIGNTQKPATGRVLVEFQHGVLCDSEGIAAGSYGKDLALACAGHVSSYSFTVPPDPVVRIIDLAARGVAPAIAKVILKHFGWANGSHVDPWTDLSWLPIFGGGITPTGEAASTYWPKYRAGLAAIFAAIRTERPDWIVLGQDFHLSADGRLNAQVNGLFIEQYPGFGHTTLADHAADKVTLSKLHEFAALAREPVHAVELRDFDHFDPAYVQEIFAWAEQNGFYVSCGRDATARVP